MTDNVLADAKDKMAKAAHHLQDEFGNIRTGRATPAVVERLKVDYYGSETPLKQLASFSVPEPRQLLIQPFDKSAIKAIEKAITNSDLSIQPNNDGQVIRLNFPPLTQDRRKELVKVVKAKAEEARVAIRNIRRHSRQHLEHAQKEGSISEGDLNGAEKRLEKMTQDSIADIDKVLAHKEHELLEV